MNNKTDYGNWIRKPNNETECGKRMFVVSQMQYTVRSKTKNYYSPSLEDKTVNYKEFKETFGQI